MSASALPAKHLLLTELGEAWLRNFDANDRPIARELVAGLSLVSHNEFERGLTQLIAGVSQKIIGTLALYGARELPSGFNLLKAAGAGAVDATPRGSE